jgi:RimJ/RimL family protein N-acetyltransferase
MLKGQLLTLRAIERADLPRWCQFNNDTEVELASGGDPPTPQSLARLEAEFEQNIGRGGKDGMTFAIEAHARPTSDDPAAPPPPGIFIGQCALFNVNDTAHTCELGIIIGDKAYWGRSYGREAVRLLLDYAFRLRNFHKVFLTVQANNMRAIRSYEACGFAEEGRLRQHVWSNGQYFDLVYMGILREEWRARQIQPNTDTLPTQS